MIITYVIGFSLVPGWDWLRCQSNGYVGAENEICLDWELRKPVRAINIWLKMCVGTGWSRDGLGLKIGLRWLWVWDWIRLRRCWDCSGLSLQGSWYLGDERDSYTHATDWITEAISISLPTNPNVKQYHTKATVIAMSISASSWTWNRMSTFPQLNGDLPRSQSQPEPNCTSTIHDQRISSFCAAQLPSS